MDPVLPLADPGLEALRRRRAELRESMDALEQALAAPAPGRTATWMQRVHVALVELSADVREHVDQTEAEDGLYQGILATAPRLSHAVAALASEHRDISARVGRLLAETAAPAPDQGADRVRESATLLLGRLVRHRQRGADLVYEAYEADVGGES